MNDINNSRKEMALLYAVLIGQFEYEYQVFCFIEFQRQDEDKTKTKTEGFISLENLKT